MLNRRKYTDSEMNTLLKSMVVLVDTREHSGKNDHILDYFDKHKIAYKKMALPALDYSLMLPANPELNVPSDLYFYNDIAIERKANAEELSGNFSQNRERFNDEFSRARCKRRYLIVENCNYSDIVDNKYNTQYSSKSYLASLHSFNMKYDLQIVFMPDKSYTPIFIIGTLQYYLRYLLK